MWLPQSLQSQQICLAAAAAGQGPHQSQISCNVSREGHTKSLQGHAIMTMGIFCRCMEHLIKQDLPRVAYNGSGNGNALLLASRNSCTLFTHQRVIPVRHSQSVSLSICCFLYMLETQRVFTWLSSLNKEFKRHMACNAQQSIRELKQHQTCNAEPLSSHATMPWSRPLPLKRHINMLHTGQHTKYTAWKHAHCLGW